MALYQHRHAQLARQTFHLLHLRQRERGDDQQDRVGAHRPRFEDLIGVDHEVLAQHRQATGRAGGLEKLRCALEVLAVGEHRQAGGTAGLVGSGDLGGTKILADHTLRGAGLLDLGNDRGVAGSDPAAQAAGEIAGRRGIARLRTQARLWHCGTRGGDLGALGGEDPVEDVTHQSLT